MNAFIWLGMLIVFLVIEIATLGLTTIWFAGGSLAAFVASLLGAPLWVQLILFFVISLGLLFVTRPIAVKYFNRDRVKTNVEDVIGRQAIVTGEIDNLKGAGQAAVGGMEWTARSVDDQILEKGTVVRIKKVDGVKLIVEKDMKEMKE